MRMYLWAISAVAGALWAPWLAPQNTVYWSLGKGLVCSPRGTFLPRESPSYLIYPFVSPKTAPQVPPETAS